ncbi:Outer membrane protein A precursor [hydrothermal vent metagenome]|uniref:Outer membrane protein A n=1 Tax=hydrothermal vent metagenome TaxID=652676 RepID=A0A3B0VPH4_9ZZZZ
MMKTLTIIMLILSFLSEAKRAKQLDYASLEKDYNNLVFDQTYKAYAKAEKQIAKKSVEALINGKVKKKNRDLAVYTARHNIAYARLVAEEQWIKQQIKQEQQKNHDFEVNISKAEAQIARHDAEVARMMLIAQQEEAQRANQRANQAEIIAQNSLDHAELLKQETAAVKRYAQAQAQEASLAKQEAELAMEEAQSLRKKLNSIATEQTDKGLMMTLGDFMFDSGKASIKKEAIENFSKVVEFINSYPDNQVRIEGHTDSSGSNALNLKLSQLRAEAVKAILVQNGIAANQIQAVGMGEDYPIAENSSNAGKAKNRRVEIVIVPEQE